MKTNRRKIYYFPGLISLVLLPLLCCIYVQNEFQKRNYRLIEVNWWNPSWKENMPKGLYPFEIYPTRNYLTINLSTENLEKGKQLATFQQNLKKLILTKDTTNGLHVIFSKWSTYGDFIAILNILQKEKAIIYVLKDNDVWVFNFYPRQIDSPTANVPELCGTGKIRYQEVLPFVQENNFISRLQISGLVSELKLLIKVWPVLVLFGVLVVLTLTNNGHKRKDGL